MSLNYNNYDSGAGFELIPKGTKAKFCLEVKPGSANIPGVDESGVLTASKNGPAIMLVATAHILYGPHAKRLIFCNWVVGSENGGNQPQEEGLQTACRISGQTLRAIVESARNIDPNDFSDAACQARILNSYNEFNGLEFAGEIGIEKDKTGYYDDKNGIKKIICRGHKDYEAIMSGNYVAAAAQAGQAGGNQWGGQSGPPPAAKPAWQTQQTGPPPAGQAPQWQQGQNQGPPQQATPQWQQTQQPPAGQNQGPVPAWTQPQQTQQPAPQPPSQDAGQGQQPNQQQNMFQNQQQPGGQPPGQQPQQGPAAANTTSKPAWAQ